ncbi:MAG: hypothetical protein HZB24_11600 [Desulfobacterales bacterium]|nr:hypothetical protein [Desulfobacterales bacterium]
MKTRRAMPILAVIAIYLVGASIATGTSPMSGAGPSPLSGSVRPAPDQKPTSVLAECLQSEKAIHDANLNEMKNRYNAAAQEINSKFSSSEQAAKAAYDAAAKAANDAYAQGLQQADAAREAAKKQAQEWFNGCVNQPASSQCKPTYDSKIQSALKAHSSTVVNLKSALASALSKAQKARDAGIESARNARDMAIKSANDTRDKALGLENDRNAKALEKCRAK